MKAIRIGLIAALLGAAALSGCNCGTPPVDPPVDPDSGDPGDAGGDPGDGGGHTPDGGGGLPDGGGNTPDGGGGVPDGGPLIPTDPGNPGNQNLDSDCDGLTDQEEFGTVFAGNKRTLP